jgi:putative hydrolase of the HAD superfamily
VVFDLYYTLVPDVGAEEYRLAQQAMAAALSMDVDAFDAGWLATGEQRFIGEHATASDSLRSICAAAGLPAGEDVLLAAAAVREVLRNGHFTPRADAEPMLRELRRRGLSIGLISDCGTDTAPLWRACPLAPLVDAAILSCEVGFRKPNPRLYQLATEALGVSAEGCLYVGDGSSQELTGATRAGMTAVQLRIDGDWPPGRETWTGLSIGTLTEVLELL